MLSRRTTSEVGGWLQAMPTSVDFVTRLSTASRTVTWLRPSAEIPQAAVLEPAALASRAKLLRSSHTLSAAIRMAVPEAMPLVTFLIRAGTQPGRGRQRRVAGFRPDGRRQIHTLLGLRDSRGRLGSCVSTECRRRRRRRRGGQVRRTDVMDVIPAGARFGKSASLPLAAPDEPRWVCPAHWLVPAMRAEGPTIWLDPEPVRVFAPWTIWLSARTEGGGLPGY